MLVLKSLGIDLTKSETRTIIGFYLLYSFLVLVILGVITFLYYKFQKDLMLQEKRQILQNYSNSLVLNLKELHINIDKSNVLATPNVMIFAMQCWNPQNINNGIP